jgi:signal transduction histidine kinase
VAGWVFQHREPLVINDCYNDPRFYRAVDKETGFRSRNILCVPLINRAKECIGALQALNKKSGDFSKDDLELLTPVSHYIAIALENSKLYEDLKLLDKAKERVINHLSHELRTPLAVLSGVLDLIARRMKKVNVAGLEDTIAVGLRNVTRLQELYSKIDDILHERPAEVKEKTINIIQDALFFVEQIKGEENVASAEILNLISERIDSLCRVEEGKVEHIMLYSFLHELCNEAVGSMKGRDLEIVRDFEKDAAVDVDPSILKKICGGLLKNAIENTPDEGRIDITSRTQGNGVEIGFHDHGVGISQENQKMIFGGFFHTQETGAYSSKEPYMFNAGGAGSDLLRMKVFSERYRFRLDFYSSRCRFIPDDGDACPGRISLCRAIKSKEDCFSSGGSTFSVLFPKA